MYFHRNIVATAVRVSVHRMAECRKKTVFSWGSSAVQKRNFKKPVNPPEAACAEKEAYPHAHGSGSGMAVPQSSLWTATAQIHASHIKNWGEGQLCWHPPKWQPSKVLRHADRGKGGPDHLHLHALDQERTYSRDKKQHWAADLEGGWCRAPDISSLWGPGSCPIRPQANVDHPVSGAPRRRLASVVPTGERFIREPEWINGQMRPARGGHRVGRCSGQHAGRGRGPLRALPPPLLVLCKYGTVLN